MAKTFSDALRNALERTDLSLRQIAERSGVSYEQLKKVNQGATQRTNVDDAARVAGALGYRLSDFLEEESFEDRVEIVEIYNRLSPRERAMLKALREAEGEQDLEEGSGSSSAHSG